MVKNARECGLGLKITTTAIILAVVILSGGFAANAASGEDYYWYDSGKKMAILMDGGLVAEFGSASDEDSAVRSAEPRASRVRARIGGGAIWRVGSSKTTLEKSATIKPGAGVSPVFREGGNPKGRIMTLPGNVVVFFKNDWTDMAVKNWASAQNLDIVNKLNIGRNAYVVKSGPGFESLNLANKLQESGQVEAAMPNWWRPLHKR